MKRILFVIFLLASAILSQAQQYDYPIRVVDGQKVYEYPVQKGEGLYRISVNFGVTQEEIIRLNPELKTSGLKLGQIILVPVKDNKPAEKPKRKPIAQAKDTVHKAPAAVPDKDIVRRAFQPKKAELAKAEAAKAEVAAEQPQHVADNGNPVQPLLPEEVFFEEDTMFVLDTEPGIPPMEAKNTLRLALLLPLQADAQTYDVRMERFLRFYEGILLALREEKRPDRRFEVFVYDIGKTEYKLRKVLAQPELAGMNAIIGPAYSEQVPLTSQFVAEHHIACLLPFTNGVTDLETNKYLLQYNPTVPEGMRIVQFKKEVDGNWAAFDRLMNTYFEVRTPSPSRPRYDILGYDLAKYFIPAVLQAMQAEDEEAWIQAFLTEHDGLQSTLRFQRVSEQGGFMNTPLKVIPKVLPPADNTPNSEEK